MRGMFVTGPLAAGDVNDGGRLRVRGAAGRTFDELTPTYLPTTSLQPAWMTAHCSVLVG